MRPTALFLLSLGWLSFASSCAEKAPASASDRDFFIDRTQQANIKCDIETGATGDHYVVETMAGGVGWIDHDADGDYDLYVARGHEQPRKAAAPGNTANCLYRNDGQGQFVDVTARAGVGDTRYSFGVAVADYDGDGRDDLFVGNFGRSTLYHNRGEGKLEDVTNSAGMTTRGWAMSAAWFDCDQDGDLDLYVTRYLKYDPETARSCKEGDARVYCHPRYFPGEADILYENSGDGVFRDISRIAGIDKAGPHQGKGLGVIALDINSDQKTDLYVANDMTPNYLWLNEGQGKFRDVAFDYDLAVSSTGTAQASMGLDWADLDGDGRASIHVTNFSRETNNLFKARADGRYFDEVQRRNLGFSYTRLGFGTIFGDFNLDGHLDLLVANGHVDDKVEEYAPQSNIKYRQPIDLYLGAQQGTFSLANKQQRGCLERPVVGRGLAMSDIDNDGDMDVAIATLDRGVVLLENNCPEQTRRVILRLVGKGQMRSAFGAKVMVRIGDQKRRYEYQSARSYLSAVDPRISLALGEAKTIDEIRVLWPNGQEHTLRAVQPKGVELVIEQP